MPSRFHGPTVAGVQAFDCIRGANNCSDLHVVVQEGNEFFPRVVPEFHDRWVSCAPFLGHVIECGPGRIRVGCRIDGSEIAFEFIPVFA